MHEAVARTRRNGTGASGADDSRADDSTADGTTARSSEPREGKTRQDVAAHNATRDREAVHDDTVGSPGAGARSRDAVPGQRVSQDDHRGEGPLYREVDSAVRTRLAELAEVTRFADDSALAAVARVELPKLADTLAQLLREHHPDGRGRCRACKHPWYRRGAAAPCRAYLSAYLGLLAADGDEHG